jgi:putative endonuclease
MNDSPEKCRQYYIYMLECINGSYYTGYTTDIDRCYQEHLLGTDKCKYTRAFPPVRIAACWTIDSVDLSAALKVEKYIKKMSKAEKLKLISDPGKLMLALKEQIPEADKAKWSKLDRREQKTLPRDN